MTSDAVLHTVSEAARGRSTVTVSLRTEEGECQAEVEPYSVVERRQQPTLFCWDIDSHRVVGLPVSELVEAIRTDHHFEPRYDVEF